MENIFGNTADMALEHVFIKYGGVSSSAAIFVGSGKFSIDNVSITDCSTAGILYSNSTSGDYQINNLTLERIGSTTSHYGVGVISSNAIVTSTNLTTIDVAGRHVSITNGLHSWRSSGSTFSGSGIKAIEIRGGTITGNEVFDDEVPYLLTAELIIADGAALTIPAGTTIFAETAGRFKNQGVLNAIGTAENPITFTSLKDDTVGGDTNGDAAVTSPAPQDWQGILTELSTAVTTLKHGNFSYGGGSQNNTVYALRGLTIIEDCLIQFSETRAVFIQEGDAILRNNTFTDTSSVGIYIKNSNGFTKLENNHFENCVAGVYSVESGVQLDASGTTAINCGWTNAIKYVETSGPVYIQEDQIWQENLLYYVTRDLEISDGVSLTLAPGTQVKVAPGSKITVKGELSAVGTDVSPIQFTSFLDDSIGGDSNQDVDATAPSAGDWIGIWVISNTTSTIDFDYVEVYYGGHLLQLSNRTEFQITHSTFAYASKSGVFIDDYSGGTFSGNSIHDVAWNGIYSGVYNTALQTNITNNSFENTGGKAMFYSIDSPFNVSGNTFSGGLNTETIRMRGGKILAGRTVTLEANQTYLFIDDGNDERGGIIEVLYGATLIVEEGAILKFDKYGGIFLDGHMEFRGTEENPIILTSHLDDTAGGDTNDDGSATTPAPGDWFNIWLRDGWTGGGTYALATGTLENFEVRYPGLEYNGSGGTAGPGILHFGGTITMKDFLITHSLHDGYECRYANGNATIDGMTIIDTQAAAMRLLDGTVHMDNVFIDEIDGASLVLRLGDLDYSLNNLEVGDNVPNNITRLLGGGTKHPTVLGHTPIVVVKTTAVSAVLGGSITVLPGTIIKMPLSSSGFYREWLDGNGHFILNGEPGNPIIFTSELDDTIGGDTNGDGNETSPSPGDWNGIRVLNPKTQFNNVEIRFAGSIGSGVINGVGYASLYINMGEESELKSFTGLHIHDAKGDALVLRDPQNWDISNSLIYDFENQGIYSYGDRTGGATLRNVTIHGGKTSISPAYAHYALVNSVLAGATESLIKKSNNNIETESLISRNNVFHGPNASLGLFYSEDGFKEITLADSVGDLIVDPMFVDAGGDNFNPDTDSPLVDAANGSLADGLDFNGFPRFDDPAVTDTGVGNPSYADIGAIEQLGSSDPTLNPDLTVDGSSITFITTSGKFFSLSELLADPLYSPNQSVKVEYKVTNEGASAALGNWVDSLYFSRNRSWEIGNSLAGSSARPSTLAPGASYTHSIVTFIPPLVDGSYHLIIRTDDRGEQLEYQNANNTGTSSNAFDLEVQSRAVTEIASLTFAAGQRTSQLFRIDASTEIGNDICVEVSATGPKARIELLAQVDGIPTVFENAAKADGLPGETATVQVPITGKGMVYILITVDDPGPEPNNVSVVTSVKPFSITELLPSQVGNNGPVTIVVKGAAFQKGDRVSIRHVDGDPVIDTTRTIFRNSGCLTAAFSFQDEKLGNYDVIVSRTDDSVVLVSGVTLIQGAPVNDALLPTISLNTPDVIRLTPLVPFKIEVSLTNPHGQDIPVLLNFASEFADFQPGGLYSTSPVREGRNSLFLIPSSETGTPGMIATGETIVTTVYYLGIERNNPGDIIIQDLAAIAVNGERSNISNVNEDSIYHDEFLDIIGNTIAENHRAASDEAARLAELGVVETDLEFLLQNIYDRHVTGFGSNSIGGVVQDSAGQPIGNATVRVVSTDSEEGRSYEGTTNSKGEFLTEGLPGDEYVVVTDGYGSSPNTVVVHGGQVSDNNTFVLPDLGDDSGPDDLSEYRHLSFLQVEDVPHLFFVRRNLVFTTRYENNAWTEPEIVGAGTNPVPVYSPTLYDGGPAIIVLHERAGRNLSSDIDVPVDPNDVQLLVALSLPDGEGGWIRHEPVEYAFSDDAAFSSFDSVLTADGEPIVLWTGGDVANQEDDTDLYYRTGPLESDLLGEPLQLVSNVSDPPPQAKLNETIEFYLPEPAFFDENGQQLPIWEPLASADDAACKFFNEAIELGFEFKKSSSKSQAKWLTRKFGTHSFLLKGVVEGEANLKEAKVAAGVDVAVGFFSDALDALDRSPNEQLNEAEKKKVGGSGKGLTVAGKARIGGVWTTNPKTCEYEFDKLTASLGLAIQARIALPNLTVYAPPLAEIYVGIAIDGVFGGEFEWATPQILPTDGKVTLAGGIGGYFTGKALGDFVEISGSLTGNIAVGYDSAIDPKTKNPAGFGLQDLSINGSLGAKVGWWTRVYSVKYDIRSGALTVKRSDGVTPEFEDGAFVTYHADGNSLTRTIITPDGWQIEETVTLTAKPGTNADYSASGISSLLADVMNDFEDESRPALITMSSGETYAFWIREKAVSGSDLTNDILMSEFVDDAWTAPMVLPTTGANREVRAVEDSNGQLLLVFAHADMTGFDANSDVSEAMAAYEDADLCYIRKTDTGWTTQQQLGSIPGTANRLKVHRLPNGDVFTTWVESNLKEGLLHVQMWDSANLFWLPSKKLTKAPVASNAALSSVGEVPMAIWSEFSMLDGAVGPEERIEELTYSTLTNGNWSIPTALNVSFFTPVDDNATNSVIQPIAEQSYDFPESENQSFSDIFNLNKQIELDMECCKVLEEQGTDGIPDARVPKVAVDDARERKRKKVSTTGSNDPNDKFGLSSFGQEGWIEANQVIPYTIRFENDPEEGATAAAQRVTITDTLDPDYDFDTFVFREFGWADVSKSVPANTQNFQIDVDYQNSDGSPLIVRVTGAFDRNTGDITIIFDSIDPATGITPFGAFDGFLQVEDESGNGQGFVRYDVKQKPDLPQGTKFENIADIIFDLNESILTPEVVHTIDLEKPTSSASSPAVSQSASFPIILTGSDPGGSGVEYWTIYQSIDGGPFFLWRGAVDVPNPVFTGTSGRSYSFYSIATDGAGLREDKDPLVETTTIVADSGIRVELMEKLTNDTVRIILLTPEGLGAEIRAETTDLTGLLVWHDIPEITVTELGENRYEIIAPFTEDSRQFYRLIAGDGQ